MDLELFRNIGVTALTGAMGAAMGLFFFYTLRIITRKISSMKKPGLVVTAGLFARMVPTVAAAYLAARIAGLGGILFFLGGFLCVKFLFIAFMRNRKSTAP